MWAAFSTLSVLSDSAWHKNILFTALDELVRERYGVIEDGWGGKKDWLFKILQENGSLCFKDLSQLLKSDDASNQLGNIRNNLTDQVAETQSQLLIVMV